MLIDKNQAKDEARKFSEAYVQQWTCVTFKYKIKATELNLSYAVVKKFGALFKFKFLLIGF